MKHAIVLAGFALVAFALYRALHGQSSSSEPTGTLPQPAAPGLDHV
jgi:hypothetical protein